MTNDMEQQLAALRAVYAEKLSDHVEEIATAIAAASDSEGAKLRHTHLEDIQNMAHKLVGSGSTFGFPSVSTVSRDLETICKEALASDDKDPLAVNGMLIKACQKLRSVVDEASVSIETVDEAKPVSFTDDELMMPPVIRQKSTIVVMDLDQAASASMKAELEQFGYDIRMLNHPKKLLQTLQEAPADIVVSGIIFDGDTTAAMEVLKTLHTDENAPALVFCTALDTVECRLAAVRVGAESYMVKPIDMTDLVDVLDNITRQGDKEPYRVLIVDDDESLARHTDVILRGAGMETRVLTDPLSVLTALVDFSPELVLLDLYMPKCSGEELAGVIRQNSDYAGIPIVFLSSEVDREKQIASMKFGVDGFLTKPILPSHLIAFVRTRAWRFRQLRSFMVRDSMTGLYNHTTTKQLLETEMGRAKRNDVTLSLASIDIDHFKKVNDAYGHPVGDQVIKGLARLLRQRLRGADVIGRMGGEEFAVVLPECDIQQAKTILEDVRKMFSEMSFHGEGHGKFSVTISIGIAASNQFDTTLTLSDASDKALYAAKSSGRNRVVLA